jgi:glutamate synthase (NADPH/NADH) small chain
VPVKGSEFTLETDLVIVAVGSGANPLLTQSTPDLVLNRRGYILTDPLSGKTSKRGVWAGGDIVTGAATVILAMGAGRQAANSMHQFLTWGW